MKTKVTEQVFDTVKFMTKGGASIAQCCATTGLSSATLTYIRRADTYEKYKEIMLQSSGGHRKMIKRLEEAKKPDNVEPEPQVVEHHQSLVLVANQYMAEQLSKQTELLTLINNKLTLIAEDLGCFRSASNE